MSPAAIVHAVRPGGPWQRVLRGVFATFTGPLSPLHRLRAARLYAGDGALVTGAWACWMSGLAYGPPVGDEVEVLVARDVRLHGTGFVVVRRTVRMPAASGWIGLDDAGALPPPHLVIDELAPLARPGEILMVPTARAVVDAVVRRRPSADRLSGVAGRPGADVRGRATAEGRPGRLACRGGRRVAAWIGVGESRARGHRGGLSLGAGVRTSRPGTAQPDPARAAVEPSAGRGAWNRAGRLLGGAAARSSKWTRARSTGSATRRSAPSTGVLGWPRSAGWCSPCRRPGYARTPPGPWRRSSRRTFMALFLLL